MYSMATGKSYAMPADIRNIHNSMIEDDRTFSAMRYDYPRYQ